MKARVIAFYLPQYHPIPENDAWWGKGFTEWTNVGKAKPLFKGHYQPRVPADLGYYDLRLPLVREQQAEMAREAGVEGFMYWHYWFGNGRTLLADIFNEVLESGKPDFPFCLGWGNHSWKRRSWNSDWQYKGDCDMIEQTYPGEEDHIAHFMSMLPAFKDKRYITVDGKPLFVIWAPNDIPDVDKMITLWNKLAVENGLKGIHMVGIQMVDRDDVSSKELLSKGYNAIITSSVNRANRKINGRIKNFLLWKLRQMFPKFTPLDKFKYKDLVENYYVDLDKEETTYPAIIPNWDRSPRGGRRALIYTGSTPDLFKRMCNICFDLVKHKKDEHKIVFLRSWNEWAEGNYMEPDIVFGHGYLDALRDSLKE